MKLEGDEDKKKKKTFGSKRRGKELSHKKKYSTGFPRKASLSPACLLVRPSCISTYFWEKIAFEATIV